MENNNKNKIILIASAIIIVVIIVVLSIYLKSTNREIKQILKNNGFIYNDKKYKKQKSVLSIDEYNQNYENKINSYYELLEFYMKNYQLRGIIKDYDNGLETNIFLTYDYKEEMLTFTFLVDYKNNYYTFDGYLTEYNQLECEVIDDDGELTTNDQKTICSGMNDIVLDFQKQADDLFDEDVRKKMK